MPSAARKKKAAQVVAPTPPEPTPAPPPVAQSNPDGLPVVYPTIDIVEYSTTSKAGPLTVEKIKKYLRWETEEEYQQRMVQERPGTKPTEWLYGDTFHCFNMNKQKVRCLANANNRPFDMKWCEDLMHTILAGQWCGPHTIPGETVNGETVRISRYGRVISGQHQMTACILASESLRKQREIGNDHPDNPKYPVWRTHGEVFLETIVVRGVSEDPRVLMSIDYVKPRTAADVFYTSPVFKDSKPSQREELCRLLAQAVTTLWDRTDTQGYATHPELVAFLERHRKLLDCVLHLYNENGAGGAKGNTRRINLLRLNPGTCAALMFIQASSGPRTNGDVYRNELPPSEANLDFSYWNRAEEFWTLLANGPDFLPVRTALHRLTESDPAPKDGKTPQGLGGRSNEKLALLAKAWEIWRDHPSNAGPPFTGEDITDGGVLSLAYGTVDANGKQLPPGEIQLLDIADFMGIDFPAAVGDKKNKRSGTPMPPPPTREEIERAQEEARARRQQA